MRNAECFNDCILFCQTAACCVSASLSATELFPSPADRGLSLTMERRPDATLSSSGMQESETNKTKWRNWGEK